MDHHPVLTHNNASNTCLISYIPKVRTCNKCIDPRTLQIPPALHATISLGTAAWMHLFSLLLSKVCFCLGPTGHNVVSKPLNVDAYSKHECINPVQRFARGRCHVVSETDSLE